MSTRLLSVSAEEVLPRNRLRKSWVIQNEDSAIDVFIKRERGTGASASATDHDHLISAGAAISLNNITDGVESIQDRWSAVAASGTPRISFLETEDVVR